MGRNRHREWLEGRANCLDGDVAKLESAERRVLTTPASNVGEGLAQIDLLTELIGAGFDVGPDGVAALISIREIVKKLPKG